MKCIHCLILFVLSCAGPVWSQDAPTLPGKDLEPVSRESVQPLIGVCESCHGAGGNSERAEVPAIAGKPAADIVAALEAFYYYERHCPSVEYPREDGVREVRSMCDVTNQLNQQEALALAEYFEAAGEASQ